MTYDLLEQAKGIHKDSRAVDSIYQVKLGGLLFSPVNPDEALEQETVPHAVYETLCATLRKHPNVFELEQREVDSQSWSAQLDRPGLIRGPQFVARLKIPTRLQTARYFGIEDTIESFNVVSSGSIFCAYAKLPRLLSATHFAQEYRELVVRTLRDTPKFWAEGVGPTPIHPDIYLVSVETNDGMFPLSKHLIERNKLAIFADSTANIDDIAADVERAAWLVLDCFYGTMLLKRDIEMKVAAANGRFQGIASLADNFVREPWWNFRHKAQHANTLTRALSFVHQELVAHDTYRTSYIRSLKNLQAALRDNELIGRWTEYFIETCQSDERIPSHLPHSLLHFEGYATSHRTTQTAFKAAASGAVVGAVAAALLALLGGAFRSSSPTTVCSCQAPDAICCDPKHFF